MSASDGLNEQSTLVVLRIRRVVNMKQAASSATYICEIK